MDLPDFWHGDRRSKKEVVQVKQEASEYICT